MRTSKPVATITYNTQPFLEAKLKELLRNKKIQDYIYIFHIAEEDEKKNHIHLYIEPNTLLDTMDLQEFLSEPDPKYPDKPLKPQKFVFCRNLDTWILYAEHYPAYLASIYEERKNIYTINDFHFADENAFYDNWLHAHKGSEWAHRQGILTQLKNPDIDGLDLLFNGSLPINLATQLAAIDRMKIRRIAERQAQLEAQAMMESGNGKVNRNGGKSHTPKKN